VDLSKREEFLRNLQAVVGLGPSRRSSVGAAFIPSLFDISDLLAASYGGLDAGSAELNAQTANDIAKFFAGLAKALAHEELENARPARTARKARGADKKSREEDASAVDSDKATDEAKRALTVDEAARLYSVSRSSLYNLIKAGRLPDVKMAGRRLLPRDALEDLISGKRA
jgi:excisionase family DNA binding protein